MDLAQWSIEVARIVGPVGAVVLFWAWLARRGSAGAVTELAADPPPGIARMIELLTEIRDGVRDAGHEREAMKAALDRIERSR